ncbi:MAG: YtxH domain-containing protein [bacterium]
MSEDNKNLRDDLDDMLGDAKEGARKAAAKAEEIGQEAKEKAKEFAGEAKEAAKDFADDAKEVLSDGKNVAIIAHITLIGWIIAIVMNSSNKNEFSSFYIRQVLGIFLLLFVCSFIPFVNLVAWLVALVMWIMSLIGAIGGEKKEVFLLGSQFQSWFKSL